MTGRLKKPHLRLHARPGVCACFCKRHRPRAKGFLETGEKRDDLNIQEASVRVEHVRPGTWQGRVVGWLRAPQEYHHAPGVTGAARGCEGDQGKKCQFYKKRGGKTGLFSLANGACEGR